MTQSQQCFCGALALFCFLTDYAEVGLCQTSSLQDAAIVQRIMSSALSRCYSRVNGVTRISFEPPTDQEFAEIKALGGRAIAPLAEYFDREPKGGFLQLFAVKFLMAIGDSQTLPPLKRAFAQDQWEATRAAALVGMFRILPSEAKPYVEAGRTDKSEAVRRRAEDLWLLYEQQQQGSQTTEK